jgi:hypothetical protein
MTHYAADPVDKIIKEILDEIDARIVYQRKRRIRPARPVSKQKRRAA